MSKLILLVEDNGSDEKLTLAAFKKAGVEADIVVERDGAAALDYLFRDSSRMPELVLLDLKLPKVDGLEVLRRLRADDRTKNLPIVVLTASKEEEDVARSYALGVNAYVRKPVDFSEFVRAAQAIGIVWLVLNEPAPERRKP